MDRCTDVERLPVEDVVSLTHLQTKMFKQTMKCWTKINKLAYNVKHHRKANGRKKKHQVIQNKWSSNTHTLACIVMSCLSDYLRRISFLVSNVAFVIAAGQSLFAVAAGNSYFRCGFRGKEDAGVLLCFSRSRSRFWFSPYCVCLVRARGTYG